MLKKLNYILIFMLIAINSFIPLSSAEDSQSEQKNQPPIQNKKLHSNYGNIPLYFIQNQGQVADNIKYYEKGQGHTTYFKADGIHLHLSRTMDSADAQFMEEAHVNEAIQHEERIRLFPVNANTNPKMTSSEALESRVNYFMGKDPAQWQRNLSTYRSVMYQDVYKGVDMKFYGNNRQLEYDIIVSPGADPSTISLAYEGVEDLNITEDGSLEILLKQGKLVQKKPYIYQEIAGKRVEIDGVFKILKGHPTDSESAFVYGFEVAAYNKSLPLTIDPVIDYSTYLGGASDDLGHRIVVDAAGNTYVTGITASSDFPTTAPIQGALGGGNDIFVAKINAAGTAFVYTTYLGGSGNDTPWGIDVDSAGSVYITGETLSPNFPVMNPIQASLKGGIETFVTKINAAGSALDYSTFLGDKSSDSARDIAVDASGNAYIVGGTNSSNFPTSTPIQGSRAGFFDAFVSKINAAGSALLYSTYVGGEGNDFGYGIAVDDGGNAFITGKTNSYAFPTVSPFQSDFALGLSDAFVTKINASGTAYDYSTYLGGAATDEGKDIALDAAGNAYITGHTHSVNFPTSSPIQGKNPFRDLFVTKMNVTGTALVYSTYLGGNGNDIGHGIAVDPSGNAYIIGETASTDFPTAQSIQAGHAGGSTDVFISVINDIGSSLAFSTYLGGGGTDIGYGIALDASGSIYVTGNTRSSNFPTVAPIQSSNAGGAEAFISKISNVTFDTDITVTDSVLPNNDLTIAFGDVTVGTASNQVVTITNSGSANLVIGTLAQIDGVAVPFSIITDNCSGQTLTPSGNCTVNVRFSPTAEVPSSDSFDIPSNDPDESSVTFILTGTGVPIPTPDITVSDSMVPANDLTIPFGNVAIGEYSEKLLTITNDGSANLVIGTLAQVDLIAAPFSLLNDNCSGQTLSPAASCTLDVRYTPAAEITSNDSFDIPSDDPDESALTFNVSGTGTPTPTPDITVTDSIAPGNDLTIAFGNLTVGTSSDQTFTITNDGSADLVIGTLAQVDLIADPFSLLNDNCSGQTLSPAANCTLNVRFSPTAENTSNDSFDMPSNDFDENPVIVNLSGTGTPVPTPDITVADSVAPNNDLSLPFGNITEGTESIQLITLSNDGNADLIVGTLAQSNTLSAPFSIQNDTCSGQTLTPSTNCSLGVHFSPSDLTTSNDSFDIPSNDPDESAITINLSGTGAPIVSDIVVIDSVSPVADLQVPFGDITTGTASTQIVTITNAGDGALVISPISGLTLSATPFSVLNDLCSNQTLALSESCTFDIRFAPTTAAIFNDSLEIPSNDPDENPVTLNVSGTGLQAIVNNPPSKPTLVFPANGQIGLPQDVTFEWTLSTDPDGDPVTYDLYVCENPNPANCAAQQVASLKGHASGTATSYVYGVGFVLLGIVYLGCGKKRTLKNMTKVIAMLLITGTVLVACSGGGGGSGVVPGPINKSGSVTGLAPNTLYYWSVVAKDDQGGVTQSDIWQFRTQ